MLRRFGLVEKVGEAMFFPTLGVAVSSYLSNHRVDWIDWEEQL